MSSATAGTTDIDHLVRAEDGQSQQLTMVVRRLPDGETWVANSDRSRQRFSPASTSKIPHTLIALESGLATPETVFPWDGTVRGNRNWNQDQTLASAYQHSAVWVFQEIAQAAGSAQMSAALRAFAFGNASTGSAENLPTYWLDGTLRISATEQVTFLSRLAQQDFPLSNETYASARNIMLSDQQDNWVMRSKTGWFFSEDETDIGWHVGWVECGPDTYVFALNMGMPNTSYLARRTATSYRVLEAIGAFDCQ